MARGVLFTRRSRFSSVWRAKGGYTRAEASASESRGKHHKPEGETSQWFTPGWNESSRRDNPYARDAEKPRDDKE